MITVWQLVGWKTKINHFCTMETVLWRNVEIARDYVKQEAQLPQRNSASAAHIEGGARPSNSLAFHPSGYM